MTTYAWLFRATMCDVFARCCQTKANQSHLSINLNPLGYAKTAPLGKSGGTLKLEI
jgi:hypothetical protein